jgi:hypothetical protein
VPKGVCLLLLIGQFSGPGVVTMEQPSGRLPCAG